MRLFLIYIWVDINNFRASLLFHVFQLYANNYMVSSNHFYLTVVIFCTQ